MVSSPHDCSFPYHLPPFFQELVRVLTSCHSHQLLVQLTRWGLDFLEMADECLHVGAPSTMLSRVPIVR
jgi:hypothetical protein